MILGAGLAGLAAARTAAERGLSWTLVEREERPGGLCRTESREGFLFDATGHWLHLRNPGVRALVAELLPDLLTVERRAVVHAHGRFLPYPYQTGFGAAGAEIAAENLLGFVDAVLGPGGAELRSREPRTFEEFILRHLGAGIARNFMVPYNQKLWTVHPRELSPAWTQRFVPRPPLEDVVRGALGLATGGAGYNATFLYPASGGIESLPRALAAELDPARMLLGAAPRAVSLAEREVVLEDGRVLPFKRLVSTIALPELVRLVAETPAPVREAAGRLAATTVTYVNVGVSGTGGTDFHWAYFADPELPFYRIGSASAAVPYLAPAGCRSFYVEFSGKTGVDPRLAEREAVKGLVSLGLAKPADVRFAFAREIPGAYVIYDEAHGPAKATVLDWLASQDVRACGRYGGWEYSSMEDAILAGQAAA